MRVSSSLTRDAALGAAPPPAAASVPPHVGHWVGWTEVSSRTRYILAHLPHSRIMGFLSSLLPHPTGESTNPLCIGLLNISDSQRVAESGNDNTGRASVIGW